jgi:hypothetical protein
VNTQLRSWQVIDRIANRQPFEAETGGKAILDNYPKSN